MTKVLLLALLTHAAHPADAPVAAVTSSVSEPGFVLDQDKLGSEPLLDVRSVEAGEPAPAAGCWLDDQSCIAVARRVDVCEKERDALRQDPPFGWWLLAGSALAGIVVGAGATWLLLDRAAK